MNSEYYTVNSKSFRFDVGPSLLLLPDIYKETLSSLNDGRIQNSIEFLPVHPFYRIFFEKDNTHIDISNDMINMKQQIESQFSITNILVKIIQTFLSSILSNRRGCLGQFSRLHEDCKHLPAVWIECHH